MKIKKGLKILLMLGLVLTACKKDDSVKTIENKNFTGVKGGSIVISKSKSKNEKTLIFSGSSVIKPNTDPSKVKEGASEKSKPKEFKNPKIVKKDDGKYLVADGFEYKLKVIDDNTILDVEDNNEYKALKK